MIKFLRDDFENTWEHVARLCNEYWGSNVRTRKLSRRYAVNVPKVQQGTKKVGRLFTGDKTMGIKGNGEAWAWMESWETRLSDLVRYVGARGRKACIDQLIGLSSFVGPRPKSSPTCRPWPK
jgi:hypothetical protein